MTEPNLPKESKIGLPIHPERAAKAVEDMNKNISSGEAFKSAQNVAKTAGDTQGVTVESERRKRASRESMQIRTASSVGIAIDKKREPLQSLINKGIPHEIDKREDRIKARQWCRKFYKSHNLQSTAIDIYSQFPIQGMEITSKDPELKKFYETLFFDQLKYETFLEDFGREYWTVGEVNSLGNWNETLGIWDREQILNPDDIIVSPGSIFSVEPLFYLQIPETIQRIIDSQTPYWQYQMLRDEYPEIFDAGSANSSAGVGLYYQQDQIEGIDARKLLSVSPHVLSRAVKAISPWETYGTPHMMRAFGSLIMEESLNAAQDAVADRLYSPMILAKLGTPALDDGSGGWIPSPEQMEEFTGLMQSAFAADFRFLTYHYGIEIKSVFGRESLPNFDRDYDRLERKMLQVWGIGEGLISGSNSGSYASSALNREFVTQLMSSFQKKIKEHFKKRCEIVAEAQEHFDYESSNGVRTVITEEVLETDDETGEQYIRTRPKLLLPELNFKCLVPGTRVYTPNGPVANETLIPGDSVLAWDTETDSMVESIVIASYDNGIEPVYKINTVSGREISATEEHPFLTDHDWIKANQLSVGDKVRVGTNYKPRGASSISERDAYFLGLMVGDGGCTGRAPRLSSVDLEIIGWTNQYLSGFGCGTIYRTDVDYDLSQIDSRVRPNPVITILKDAGVWGKKSYEKDVPSNVWSGGPFIWAAFLSGLLDTDGTVTKTTGAAIWYTSSQNLAKSVQTLLSFLGVKSSVHSYIPDGFETERVGYRISVHSKKGRASLQRILSPLLKRKQNFGRTIPVDIRKALTPEQAIEVKIAIASKAETYKEIGARFGVSSSTINRVRSGEYDYVIEHSKQEAEWDEISSIELLAPTSTWSLGIAETHTHITEGLVTHNTMNLRDEGQERQFLQTLKLNGIPVSDQAFMVNIDLEFPDELEKIKKEKMDKVIAEQEFVVETFKALSARGLPIPVAIQSQMDQLNQDAAGDVNSDENLPGVQGRPDDGLPGTQGRPEELPGTVGRPQNGPKDKVEGLPMPGAVGRPGEQLPGQIGRPSSLPGNVGRPKTSGIEFTNDSGDSGQDTPASSDNAIPDITDPAPTPNVAPDDENEAPSSSEPSSGNSSDSDGGGGESESTELPRNEISQRPEVSDEQRANSPRASAIGSLRYGPSTIGKRSMLNQDSVDDAINRRPWTRSLRKKK